MVWRKGNFPYDRNLFEAFLESEMKDTENDPAAMRRVARDIQDVMDALAEDGAMNERTRHPFMTDSQIVVAETYLDGELSNVLLQQTEKGAKEYAAKNDRLFVCMLQACDGGKMDGTMDTLAGMRDRAMELAGRLAESEGPKA